MIEVLIFFFAYVYFFSLDYLKLSTAYDSNGRVIDLGIASMP